MSRSSIIAKVRQPEFGVSLLSDFNNKSYMEHWVQPIKYLVTNTPTRSVRRHSKRRMRCDGNGILTRGRK